MEWPVVPLCEAQLKDVRPEDVLEGGLYRRCDTYRGGGGYDQFNRIYEKRTGLIIHQKQFVVQLKGCPLKCPYCYVTTMGVNGEPVMVDTEELYKQWFRSGCEVFHLMGGAPALYLPQWKHLGKLVEDTGGVFHSDFLLVEHPYSMLDLVNMPGLHAVSIKEKSLYTEKQLFFIERNLRKLQFAKVNFYLTFTGETAEMERVILQKFGVEVFEDSFHIDIIDYEAIKYGKSSK